MQPLEECSDATGASLVGLLMMVVVLGGLAALAVVGVSNLGDNSDAAAVLAPATTVVRTGAPVDRGPGRGVACVASADAARTAAAMFYVTAGAYPTRWSDLTAGSEPALKLPAGVTVNGADPKQLDGFGWKMLITGDGGVSPTFACQPTP